MRYSAMDERVLDKLDSIEGRVTSMQVVQERHSVLHEQNAEQLREHIRRTGLLEDKVAHIEDHVQNVQGVVKFVGVMAVLVGLMATMKELIK
jgi:uncharacterized protein (UPF0335 family)